ncbi:hypothetical protein MF672_028580 [Actinomadura sp. ATCC 31491]|uniref:Uncharacterized protein n=1 Tax=Actinomadura luzonensis TaxID=2805427 RepID=A0ABT0FZI1_9ACTN|nr:hypothetical protein [Actinomadura luzonensis]MCK2217720.1 hypothetical protein [Actinomadura luzonensis]
MAWSQRGLRVSTTWRSVTLSSWYGPDARTLLAYSARVSRPAGTGTVSGSCATLSKAA